MLTLLLLNRMNSRRFTSKRPSTSTGIEHKDDSRSIYCRTCLSTEGLVSIFIDKSAVEKRCYELKLVTGLEIRKNDGLSQKMCTKCINTINAALELRKQSRKAEKILIKMLDNVTLNAKPKKRNLSDEKPLLKVEVDVYDHEFTSHEDFQIDYEDTKVDIKDVVKNPKLSSKSRKCVIPNASSYKCHICCKEFRMKATYMSHLRFHTHFCVCEACGKRCRNNNQLQEHKRARHGLGRIHKCAYCEYSSATKEALTIHERRHTGERPYICDHCGASFHRRSNLVQHIAIHLPEKNFQCDLCPKRLKSKKFLQIHKHNAHTGKRYGYLCGICSHRFEKPNKVRAHARRVHGVPDEHQGPVARVQL